MTTFYTPSAEKTMARALADKERAAAEAQRAQTELTRIEAERARAVAAEEFTARRAARVAAQRKARQQEARDRRTALMERLSEVLPAWLLSVLWATVIIAPITLAWQAQQRFAESTLHIDAAWSWLFPLAVEAGAWVCAFEAHRRARRGDVVGALPMWMWVLALIAGGINFAHGWADHDALAGAALLMMSLLGVLLHHIRSTVDHAAANGRTAAELRRAAWRRVRYPRLSFAAASIAVARGDVTGEQAWVAAWVDRYGVGPDSSRRDRRVARLIVTHQREAERDAARNGGLLIVDGAIVTAAVPERQPAEPVADEATPETVTTPEQDAPATGAETVIEQPAETTPDPIAQPKLPPKAHERLEQVRAAITAGELPAVPAASAIAARFGGSTVTARWVRDYLKQEAA